MTQGQAKTEGRQATLHRMVLPDHICQFGVKAKQLLEERGLAVDDLSLIHI